MAASSSEKDSALAATQSDEPTIFDKIIKKEIPSKVVYEDEKNLELKEDIYIGQGWAPARRVHPISSLSLPITKCHPFPNTTIKLASRHQHFSSAVICTAALRAKCAAEQTQTVTRESSTITIAPIKGKEKSPELDDGGTGFPPRDDDGGGGGGGGGGGHWSGGFFFFGLLAFLGLLKDQESEGPYRNNKRRY